MSVRCFWMGAAALILLSGQAFAQGAVQELSPVVPGHLPMWAGTGLLMDGGGSTGLGVAPQNQNNAGTLPTGLGVVNSGLGYCAFSAYASVAYNSLCWGFDGSGNALIDLETFGGPTPTFTIRIAGIDYPIGSLSGMTITASNAVLPTARTNLGLGTTDTPAFAGVTLTGSFTAPGLVTNADLANPATTVNGQTCTLGASCTVTASAGSVTVGTTTVAGGTAGRVLYDNGTLGELTTTGSGSVALSTGATLVAPILGTPSSGVATNLTGTASGLTAGTVTTNANLTGPITSSGNATAIASQTGIGTKFVVDTSPTIVTPTITGSFTATGLVTNADLVSPATTVNGQTCTLGSTCTVTAAATSLTVGTTTIGSGTTGRVLYDNGGTLGEMTTSGTGTVLALASSPSLTTPTIGVATATSVNKLTLTQPSSGATLTIADGKTLTDTSGVGAVLLKGATGGGFAAAVAADIPATTLAIGTSVSLSAPREYYVCTSTCTVTPPVPAAGYEFCVLNDNNVATVITLAALGSSSMYQNTAGTAYGTAGTGTFVSGGAVGDKVCVVGRDSTHYLTTTFNGTWTAS